MRAAARCARGAAAVAASLTLIVAAAPPASAHTLSGVSPTNYRSEVTAVTPATPSLRIRLLDLGRRVQLTNRGPDEVVVLGYQGEPYLRVGPHGTFENRRSPAVYQNRAPVGPASATTLPAEADATAPPSWHRISTSRTATWRDQRTRWEEPDPIEVRRAPHLTQVVVPRWTIELRRGEAPIVVEGRITWVPGPSPWPWLAVAGVLAAACASLSRLRRWGTALAAAVAAAVALDAMRTVGLAMASAGSAIAVLGAVLLPGMLSVAAWAVGLWAIDALQQHRQGGAMAAGGVGLFLAAYAGADAANLYHSGVPSAFSPTFARAALAGVLGIGLGLVGAAVIIERRLIQELRRDHPSPGIPSGPPSPRASAASDTSRPAGGRERRSADRSQAKRRQ